MKTFVYCRVSTKEQAVDGSSLATQARECIRYCQEMGWELTEHTNYDYPGVFADPGVSAWSIPLFERPAWLEIKKYIKPGDRVVFICLDRAFRSVHDFSQSWQKFVSMNVSPVFIRDRIDMGSAVGRLIGHVTAAFSQFKSDLISQRVTEGHAASRLRRGVAKKASSKSARKHGSSPLSKLIPNTPPEYSKPDDVPAGRVFRYTRVSTAGQSPESQFAGVTRIAERLIGEGNTFGGDYQDFAVSAYKIDLKDRPEGSKLWSELQKHDIITASRLDRLFRSVRDMSVTMKELQKRGVHIVTDCGMDTRHPQGRQVIELLALVGEWESRSLGWRIKLAIRHAQQLRGKWMNEETLPRWMEMQENEHGHATPAPKWEIIEQYRDAYEMKKQGVPNNDIVDAMEAREAKRWNRPELPRHNFSINHIRHVFGRKKISKEHKAGFERWLANRKKQGYVSPDGHVSREWNARAGVRVRSVMKEIDSVIEVFEERLQNV